MARSRTRKRTTEEKKKRLEERRTRKTEVGNNQVVEKVSEAEKETDKISNNSKKKKSKTVENTTTIKLVYNERTKKCTIFNGDGEKIAEENAERLAINFASKKASFTTDKADLETYSLETGEKILSSFYSGNEIIERI